MCRYPGGVPDDANSSRSVLAGVRPGARSIINPRRKDEDERPTRHADGAHDVAARTTAEIPRTADRPPRVRRWPARCRRRVVHALSSDQLEGLARVTASRAISRTTQAGNDPSMLGPFDRPPGTPSCDRRLAAGGIASRAAVGAQRDVPTPHAGARPTAPRRLLPEQVPA